MDSVSVNDHIGIDVCLQKLIILKAGLQKVIQSFLSIILMNCVQSMWFTTMSSYVMVAAFSMLTKLKILLTTVQMQEFLIMIHSIFWKRNKILIGYLWSQELSPNSHVPNLRYWQLKFPHSSCPKWTCFSISNDRCHGLVRNSSQKYALLSLAYISTLFALTLKLGAYSPG